MGADPEDVERDPRCENCLRSMPAATQQCPNCGRSVPEPTAHDSTDSAATPVFLTLGCGLAFALIALGVALGAAFVSAFLFGSVPFNNVVFFGILLLGFLVMLNTQTDVPWIRFAVPVLYVVGIGSSFWFARLVGWMQ